jgi:hypothetical protein
VHGAIADSAGGAWTFGGSILTFTFPMILFIVVAGALYVLYTKPEFVPGHRPDALERPVSYTAVPGQPTAEPATGPQAQAQAASAAAQTPGTAPPETAADGATADGTTTGEATEDAE